MKKHKLLFVLIVVVLSINMVNSLLFEDSERTEFYNDKDNDRGSMYDANKKRGQSFTLGGVGINKSIMITGIGVILYKEGYPNGTVDAQIYSVDNKGEPDSLLTTGQMNLSGVNETPQWFNISIDEVMLERKQYMFWLQAPLTDENNSLNIRIDSVTPNYGYGVYITSDDNGTSESLESGYDANFFIYGKDLNNTGYTKTIFMYNSEILPKLDRNISVSNIDINTNSTIFYDDKNMTISSKDHQLEGDAVYDGHLDYTAILPLFQDINMTEGTFTAWIKHGNNSVTNYGAIEVGQADVNDNAIRLCYVNGDMMVRYRESDTNYEAEVQVTDPMNYHMYSAVYNSTNVMMYYDGELINMSVKSSEISTDLDIFRIGRTAMITGGTRYFNGTMDEPMIFNRDLSYEEINELYNLSVTNQNYTDNYLMAWLQFDDGTSDDYTGQYSVSSFNDTNITNASNTGIFEFKKDGHFTIVKAADFVTGSLVYDKKLGNPLELIKDSDFYKVNDKLIHERHYAYNNISDGLSVETRIATLEQSIVELNKIIKELQK